MTFDEWLGHLGWTRTVGSPFAWTREGHTIQGDTPDQPTFAFADADAIMESAGYVVSPEDDSPACRAYKPNDEKRDALGTDQTQVILVDHQYGVDRVIGPRLRKKIRVFESHAPATDGDFIG